MWFYCIKVLFLNISIHTLKKKINTIRKKIIGGDILIIFDVSLVLFSPFLLCLFFFQNRSKK